ncbi:MAG: ABC transporter permease [Hyphomicrobiales bacterium]
MGREMLGAGHTSPLGGEVGAGARGRRRARSPLPHGYRPFLLLAPLLVFLAAFYLAPLGQVALMSVTDPKPGLANFIRVLTDPFYRAVILNTFGTALLVTALCLALGYPLAYLIARIGGFAATALLTLVAMSFWTSFLVRTYAWMIILGNRGPIAQSLDALGWSPPPLLLFTRLASTIALANILLPIMVMAVYAVMRKIDPALTRAASGLGASPAAAFRFVYLPLSAPGIVSGSTIVFILCVGFYVTPVLIGSPREQMIAGVIGTNIDEFLAFGEASAMAVVLLLVTGAILAAYHRFLGLERLWG